MSDWLQQICPSPTCGMPIYDYDRTESAETLDLFCPECGEHVAHFERESLEELIRDTGGET